MPTSALTASGRIGGAQRSSLLKRGHIPIANGYLAAPYPESATHPWEREAHVFRMALKAATSRFSPNLALTGLAAAFVYGAPLLRTPTTIDAYMRSGRYSRVRFGPNRDIRLACHKLTTTMAPISIDGLPLAPIPFALVDIARFAPDEEQAAVAIDGLLRIEAEAFRFRMNDMTIRHLRSLEAATIRTCHELIDCLGPNGRAKKARQVLERVSILNESPGESRLWLRIHESGLVIPEQQVTLETRGGARRPDFLWEEEKVIAEFDGDLKYQGEEGRQRMLEDRKRDHHLAELGYRIVHFDWKQTGTASEVRRRLLAAGVPPAA